MKQSEEFLTMDTFISEAKRSNKSICGSSVLVYEEGSLGVSLADLRIQITVRFIFRRLLSMYHYS